MRCPKCNTKLVENVISYYCTICMKLSSKMFKEKKKHSGQPSKPAKNGKKRNEKS